MVKTFFALLTSILSTVFQTVVLRMLWGWFIVPLLNLRPISFLQAFTILLIVSFLRMDSIKPQVQGQADLDDKEAIIEQSLLEIVFSLLVLGVAFVAHLFL